MFGVPNSYVSQDEHSVVPWDVSRQLFFLSPWSFLFLNGEFPLSELQSTLSLFSASFPISLFSFGIVGTKVGRVTDDYPVSLHGCTRYINSSVMTFFSLFCFLTNPCFDSQ